MAERRSTYVFDRESDYEDAKNHLYHAMYSDYNDSDCRTPLKIDKKLSIKQ